MAHLVAEFSEFDKNDESVTSDALLELTEVRSDGVVEIAFDVGPKTARAYVRFSLAELVRLAMLADRTSAET